MVTRSSKTQALWGGFLIILGVVLLLQYFVDLSLWAWVIFLAVFGLSSFALYATDRSQVELLITSYVLLAIAGLLTVLELDILRGDTVAIYALSAIAVPFLYVYLRDRRAWWFLIPAYVMFVVAGLIGFNSIGIFAGDTEVSYIMFAIALPFLFVYARNTSLWWALIPGGIMAIIGFAILLAADVGTYIAPGAIILAGVWILFRTFLRPASAAKEGLSPSSIEPAMPEAEPESVET